MKLSSTFGFLIAVLTGVQAQATTAEADKPNIVYIMADDLGWTDLGCYGSQYYETPHIDRLAAQGLKLTSGYTCGPNCQPTRAALISGQYSPRTGVYTVGSIDRFNWQSRPVRPVDNVATLPLEKVTVAQALKEAGYATGMFGKWHLGERDQHHPAQRGFDEAIVTTGKHFDFRTSPRTSTEEGEYLADFLTDQSIDFIRRHKDHPFFLYLPHFGVHSPYQAKQDLIEKFKDKASDDGHNDPTYAAMIYSVDESVGRVLQTLDELGLSENTLVVFTSDNGGVGGYQREGIMGRDITDNAPLRGGKGMLYEGGIRVPFIFRWTGKVAAGSTSDEPICSVDIYPTLLDLAGGAAPHDYPLDGVSIASLLTSGGQAELEREAIYWHFPGYLGSRQGTWRTTPVGAIRSGNYKLLEFFEDSRLELYNLAEDIGEKHNLASTEQQRAQQLHAQLVRWRQQIGAQMPTRNRSE